eukprot:m.72237 g.72237  ORF g.72237 m.72237 type:complete len:77 (+) comp14238_c1_seq1:1637-1867(+)
MELAFFVTSLVVAKSVDWYLWMLQVYSLAVHPLPFAGLTLFVSLLGGDHGVFAVDCPGVSLVVCCLLFVCLFVYVR